MNLPEVLLMIAASLIAHEHGERAPLQPIHYRMAYQQLHLSGKVPHQTANKKLRL